MTGEEAVGARRFIEAVYHACSAGDYDAAARVLYNRVFQGPVAYFTRIVGAYETTLDVLTEFYPAQDLSLDPRPSSAQARRWILHETSACLHVLGQLSMAAAVGARAAAAAASVGDRHNAAISYHNLAETHLAAGALGSCRAVAVEALELATATGEMEDELVARTILGRLDDLMDKHADAEAQFARALSIAMTQTSVPILYSLSGLRYADHLAWNDRNEEALVAAQRNLDFCRAQGWDVEAALALGQLAMLAPVSLDERRARANDAVSITRTLGAKQSLAETLWSRAVLSTRAGQLDGARTDLAEVLSIASKAGYRLIEVDAREALASVRHLQGDPIGAEADAALAVQISQDLGYARGYRRSRKTLADLRHGV